LEASGDLEYLDARVPQLALDFRSRALLSGGSWFLYANAYQEFGAENRATGHKLVLRIEKTVAWPK